MSAEAGKQLFSFPRPVSLGNWQFLVFLVFLASVLAIIPARDGNWMIAIALFGAIGLAPAIVGITYYLAEPFGRRQVAAIHEHGLIWRRGAVRGFMPWSELRKIERKDRVVEGMKFPEWDIEDAAVGSKSLVLEDHPGCEEGAELIASKIASRTRAY